jgi:hypothetical protein
MEAQPTRIAESTIRWLEEVEPELELAGWLMAYSDEPLSGYDRIVVLRAHQRLASHTPRRFFATWPKSVRRSSPRTA